MDHYDNYDLTDEQWKRIQPLLPPEYTGKKEHYRKDNRIMLNGMLWMNHSGVQWRQLPESYGPWQSVYARFAKWRDDGIWETIFSDHAIKLMSMTDITGSNLPGDKAYGTKEIPAYIQEHGATVVILPKCNVKEPWPIDYCLYEEHHLVECFFQRIK